MGQTVSSHAQPTTDRAAAVTRVDGYEGASYQAPGIAAKFINHCAAGEFAVAAAMCWLDEVQVCAHVVLC